MNLLMTLFLAITFSENLFAQSGRFPRSENDSKRTMYILEKLKATTDKNPNVGDACEVKVVRVGNSDAASTVSYVLEVKVKNRPITAYSACFAGICKSLGEVDSFTDRPTITPDSNWIISSISAKADANGKVIEDISFQKYVSADYNVGISLKYDGDNLTWLYYNSGRNRREISTPKGAAVVLSIGKSSSEYIDCFRNR